MPLRVEETGIYYSFVLGSRKLGSLPAEQSDFRQPLKRNRLGEGGQRKPHHSESKTCAELLLPVRFPLAMTKALKEDVR